MYFFKTFPSFLSKPQHRYELPLLLILSLAVRIIIWALVEQAGLSYAEQGKYDTFSEQILNGNYNLENGYYIFAPFYIYFLAVVKLFFGEFWRFAIIFLQLLMASFSTVLIYKMAALIFKQITISRLAGLAYCFYFPAIWFNLFYTQETLFQLLLIASIFLLLKGIWEDRMRMVVVAALCFSACYLTKSHILLFSLFIPLLILISKNLATRRKLIFTTTFTGICLVATLPYGIYNAKNNGYYTISSSGMEYLYLRGNCDENYAHTVNQTPLPHLGISTELLAKNKHTSDILRQNHAHLPDRERMALYRKAGKQWTSDNPGRFALLKGINFVRFLLPGVSPHYPSLVYWLVFTFMLPLYLLAYAGIWRALRKDFQAHFWIAALFFVMLFFATFFYHQTRFDIASLHPFYLIYAAFMLEKLVQKIIHQKVLRLF